MANGCRTFLRIILGILTGLFLLIGLFMLGFGIALKVDPQGLFNVATKLSSDFGKDIAEALGSITSGAGVFMIVLGCVTTVISFIGFAGAISGSSLLLIIYAIVMFLFLGAEIALIVLVAAYPDKISGKFVPITNFTKEDVYFSTGEFVAPPSDLNGLSWYLVQNYFNCCGFASYVDYSGNLVVSRNANFSKQSKYAGKLMGLDLPFPVSCCKKKRHSWKFNSTLDLEDLDGCIYKNDLKYNTDGCIAKVIASNAVIPIAIAATTLGIELLLIVCSTVVACMRDHSKL